MKPPNKLAVPFIERPAELEPPKVYDDIAGVAASEPRHIVWLRLLWEERRFLGRVTVRGLILAIAVAFLLPPRYESKVRLMPPDGSSSGLAMLAAFAGKGGGGGLGGAAGLGSALGGGLGGIASDLVGMKSSGALFIDMLQGPTVEDGLIKKFDLRKVYWDRYWEDARKDLAKHTDIAEDRKSGVITLTVSDRNPDRAKQMAETYVSELDGLVAQVSTSSARRERAFIEQRLQVVKEKLDAAAQQFSEYASKNAALDVPSQAKAMVESEGQLQGNLVAAQSELEGLQQIYTDNNIRVRTLRARVAALKREVENMSGNKADLSSDTSDIAGDFPSLRKLPLLGVRWANLYRETKIQETVYELLTQQYELAKIQEAKEIPTVKVLDPARVPEKKSFPPRTIIIIFGTCLAFLLGAILVLGSAHWKQNESVEKRFAKEIWDQIRQQFSAPESAEPRTAAQRFWSRVGKSNGSGKEER